MSRIVAVAVTSALAGVGGALLEKGYKALYCPEPKGLVSVGVEALSTLGQGTLALGRGLFGKVADASWRDVVVGGTVAYTAYQLGSRVPYVKVVGVVVPGFNWVKTRVGFKPRVEIVVSGNKQTVLESMRSGSEEACMPIPRSQVLVGYMDSGVFKTNGCGIRMGDWLVVPGHVMAPCKRLAINKTSWVELEEGYEYFDLDTDLVAIKLTAGQWSKIGAACAAVTGMLSMRGDYVSVVGVKGTGTTGVLRHDQLLFGRVTYGGSTVAGYSGAGYYVANRLAGIHTNGGAVNGGYSAGYIRCILNSIDRVEEEETKEWLQQQFQDKKEMRMDRRIEGGDVRIFVDGMYTVIKKQAALDAFGTDWEKILRSDNKVRYNDVHYENLGEGKNSSSGASSLSVKSPDSPNPEALELMNALADLSTNKLKLMRRLLKTTLEDTNSQAKSLLVAESSNTGA